MVPATSASDTRMIDLLMRSFFQKLVIDFMRCFVQGVSKSCVRSNVARSRIRCPDRHEAIERDAVAIRVMGMAGDAALAGIVERVADSIEMIQPSRMIDCGGVARNAQTIGAGAIIIGIRADKGREGNRPRGVLRAEAGYQIRPDVKEIVRWTFR